MVSASFSCYYGMYRVKEFDCGPKSPRFKSHLLLHKISLPSSPWETSLELKGLRR